jgi:XRE family transcriptional regulator, regulator of sulfur utilization
MSGAGGEGSPQQTDGHGGGGVRVGGHLTLRIGPRLRELREARGMSLRQAARVAGIGRTLLSEIERQDRPDPQLSVLLKLQHAYGLRSIEELLGEPPGQPSRILAATYVTATAAGSGDSE